MLLALEGQGCWDSPRVLLGCLDCWDPREQPGRKGEAWEGQRNPPVGLQQLIFAGFCRSLPRLGYSWTTLHSPSGMSLPLGTGDDRGWAATAQSGLLGASPCTHRAPGLGKKSQWELTSVMWVSWTRSGWGGKAQCLAENRPWGWAVSPLPCNAKEGPLSHCIPCTWS